MVHQVGPSYVVIMHDMLVMLVPQPKHPKRESKRRMSETHESANQIRQIVVRPFGPWMTHGHGQVILA